MNCKLEYIGNIYGFGSGFDGSVFAACGLAPALKAVGGGEKEGYW